MLESNKGQPVLLLARPDWESPGGRIEASLSIDGGPPLKLEGHLVGPLVAVGNFEPAIVEQLSRARQLEWTLPNGRFRGDVAGLAEAWTELKACNAASEKPKGRS